MEVSLSTKKASSSLLPPPAMTPRTTRKPAAVRSVTRDEINQYWRMKQMIEEDHLLAAQKAAARIRAKALKDEDYWQFEESLKEMLDGNDESRKEGKMDATGSDDNRDLWIGFKDWWTKSKFAYLNQPAIKSMGENATTPKRPTSTYTPQYTCFCNFSPAVQLYTSSFGVFR